MLKHLLSGVKFRGKGTLLSILCPRNETIPIQVFGFTFECDLSEHIQRSIFLYGYDDDARLFIEKNLKPGDTFLDIGANVGFYSYLASSIVGDTGRVISIEPNPRPFGRLQKTIKVNKIKNILPLNIGLGEEPGFINLHLDAEGTNDSASMIDLGGSNFIRVEVLPLDSVASTHQIEIINYLKIDVEGFEPNVFRGAKGLLRENRILIVQSEFNEFWLRRNGSSSQTLHDQLTSSGFEDIQGTPHFSENTMVDRILIKR